MHPVFSSNCRSKEHHVIRGCVSPQKLSAGSRLARFLLLPSTRAPLVWEQYLKGNFTWVDVPLAWTFHFGKKIRQYDDRSHSLDRPHNFPHCACHDICPATPAIFRDSRRLSKMLAWSDGRRLGKQDSEKNETERASLWDTLLCS